MKFCPNCRISYDDAAQNCGRCGALLETIAAPSTDHTSEFDPQDISANKVIAILVYLMGAIGIIIALLASSSSKYVSFHLRQALKFLVVESLLPIAMVVGAVVNIIPVLGWLAYGLLVIAAAVSFIIIFVLKIICFFQVCKGQAKEPAIICRLGFLK